MSTAGPSYHERMISRPTGLRGRLPQRHPADRFPLRYAHEYLTVALPAPQYPVNAAEGITDFGMMGNDTYGDCGPAAEVHLEMTTAIAAGTPGPAASSSEAVDRYVAYTGQPSPPGPGVQLADYLLWCYRQGYIRAFAPVDHTDRAVCDGLMQAGFGLYVGVNLTDDAEQLFQAGEPWTVSGGQVPDPNDGHCVLRVETDGTATDGYVTWGGLQPATLGWSAACVEEAWLIVTTEEQAALFSPALLGDINALGGTGGTPAPSPAPAPPAPTPEPVPPSPTPTPEPTPTPTPTPPPTPAPIPEVEKIVQELQADVNQAVEAIVSLFRDAVHAITAAQENRP